MTQNPSEPVALLPCPFCGGANVKTFGPYGWYSHWGISHSCRAFYSGAQELAKGFYSKADAISAWNTRPAAPASDLVEDAGWQPIETAPKDGTVVLLLIEDSAIGAHWFTADWLDDGGRWEVASLPSHGCGCCSSENDQPSHWMPLPAPPAAALAQQDTEHG